MSDEKMSDEETQRKIEMLNSTYSSLYNMTQRSFEINLKELVKELKNWEDRSITLNLEGAEELLARAARILKMREDLRGIADGMKHIGEELSATGKF